jgi:hypothetical protein
MGETLADIASAAHAADSRCPAARATGRSSLMQLATSVLFVLVTIATSGALAQEHSIASRPFLNAAYRAKAQRDVELAIHEFERALRHGADPQVVHMELGYLELSREHRGDARNHFEQAANGPNEEMAANARAQLTNLPEHLWADAYFEGFGWHRFTVQSTNFVPTLRLRGFWRPFLDFDANVYVYGQITRDVSSRGRTESSLPLIYADNHALVGGGLMLRFFGGRLGVWGQAGPAFNLIDDGRDTVSFDARAGIVFGVESDLCRVPVTDDVRAFIGGCLEAYGEFTYVSRFDHDVLGMLRGRAAYDLLLTGPVLWQPLIELRALGGLNQNYYNNFAEIGVGHRWRLLTPFVVDLITTVHGGVYYGLENVDPLPDPPVFLELRLLLTTYVES